MAAADAALYRAKAEGRDRVVVTAPPLAMTDGGVPDGQTGSDPGLAAGTLVAS